jgi:competence protein ComEA
LSGRRVFGWVGQHRAVLSAALVGAVAVSLTVLLVRRPEAPRIVVQPPAATRPIASPPVPERLVVHVSGEVIAPGVYQLPVGARIDDALKAAGGSTESGDIHRLNLAARLADGQQIVVPKRISPLLEASASVPSPTPGPINLNAASVAELDRLPGVGPVTAQRIVAYREQHGPFTSIEQLRQANLVNTATFEKIKELVSV